MKTLGIDHIEINVSNLQKAEVFYDKFLSFLGYKKISDLEGGCRGWYSPDVKLGNIFIVQTEKNFLDKIFHRKAVGVNHVAFRVADKEAVDTFYSQFLEKNSIQSLYNGPKEYPEYHKGYYAVFFEDLDRIKLEVMYINLK